MKSLSKPSVSAQNGKKGKYNSSRDFFLSSYTKLILEKSYQPLFVLDIVDFSIQYVTASALRIFLKNHFSVVGESFLSITSFGDVFEKNLRLVADGRRSLHFEYFYEAHRGWFAVHIYCLDAYIFISFSDITKWKLTEEAMSELTRKVSHILDSITDAFISFDLEWRYTYVNPQAERLLNCRWQDLLGTLIEDSFPNLPCSILLNRYPRESKNEFSAKLTVEWPDGRWLHVHVYPSENGFSVYFTDITEERLVSERKDEFISVAAHELKTPVTSIYSYAQLLRRYFDKKGDEKAQQYFSKMYGQVSDLTNLVKSLLDVTRIQTGRLVLQKAGTDFNQLIRESIHDCEYLACHHRYVLQEEFQGMLTIDKHRISEVLINLLTNAVKYSPEADKVIIRVIKENGYVITSVQDFGNGIPSSDLGKIFDRFYRVNEEGGSNAGIGLGLYIALHIIKEHGGAIWVESEVGKGSTFYFSLPI